MTWGGGDEGGGAGVRGGGLVGVGGVVGREVERVSEEE